MIPYLLRYWIDLERLIRLKPERVREVQIQRLRNLVEFAREHSPFYRQLYKKEGVFDLTIRSAGDVRCLPVVTKKMMMDYGVQGVLTSDRNSANIICRKTSGSTGEPFSIYIDSHVNFTAHVRIFRSLIKFGYRPHHRAMLVGRYEKDRVLNIENCTLLGSMQKFCSLFSRTIVSVFNPKEDIVRSLIECRPFVLWSTRSILMLLADYFQNSSQTIEIPILVSTGETLLPEHREKLSCVFRSNRILNLYGCGEAGTMAIATTDERFDLFPNSVYCEYRKVRNTDGLKIGDLIISNLQNYVMPFIRYDLNDQGQVLSSEDDHLSQSIGPIEGRTDDTILLSNGFKFSFHHSYLMYSTFCECKQYRFIQKPNGQTQLWLVPSDSTECNCEEIKESALKIWERKFADVPLEIVLKDRIPLEPSGKLRAIVKL